MQMQCMEKDKKMNIHTLMENVESCEIDRRQHSAPIIPFTLNPPESLGRTSTLQASLVVSEMVDP
jgi:hypothetical protein